MLEAATRSSTLLDELTEGEREVCELILVERCTTKEIARRLGLSINGVDWRVRAARDKLGARDRNDLARIYAGLKADWGQSSVTPSPVADRAPPPVAAAPETSTGSAFVFNDAASFTLPPPWRDTEPKGLPEVLDERFGKIWRPAAILLVALGLAVGVLAVLMGVNFWLGKLV